MDSVYGFYLIDLKSKIPSFLVRPHDVSPSMKFPNDVDITSDGRYAYFTVSSSLYTLKDVADIGLLDGKESSDLLSIVWPKNLDRVIFCQV